MSALKPGRLSRPILSAAVVLSVSVAVTASQVPVAAGPSGSDARRPATITVGSNPVDIAIAPWRSEAYVLNDGSVSVLSLRTQRQIAEVGTGWQDQTAIGLVRGGTRAYLGTFDERVVKVFDTERRVLTGRIRVGYGATGLANVRTDTGGYAFVALLTAKRVAVIRTRDQSVVAQVELPRGPQTVATSPNGKQVWVGSSYSGRIWRISGAGRRVVGAVSVPRSGPVSSIAFGPGGKRAWVSGLGGVSVVSVRTGKVRHFVSGTRLFPGTQNINPTGIALNRAGTAALVVNSTFPDSPARGGVSVLDTRSLEVRRVIGLGSEPVGLGLDKRRGNTYVTNYLDDTVSWFRTPR